MNGCQIMTFRLREGMPHAIHKDLQNKILANVVIYLGDFGNSVSSW